MDKIICVGKNYKEHAKELGDRIPERPVIFLKPPSVLKSAGSIREKLAAHWPQGAGAIHFECEIVLKLSQGGYRISPNEARQHVCEATVGLDMTLRDRQTKLKKEGYPWTTAKVFVDSAIVGPWRLLDNLREEPFTLHIDGKLRQQAKISGMTLSPEDCVSYISHFFPLCEGDLLFTGTPKGVGEISSGQTAVLKWGNIDYSVTWE